MASAPLTRPAAALRPAARQGTGFVNWDSWVNANRTGAEAAAQRLMQPTQGALASATSSLEEGRQKFDDSLGAAGLPGYDPNAYVSDEDIARRADATWSGPNGLLEEQKAAAGYEGAQKANRDSERMANIYSRMGSLREAFGQGGPAYSAGQQRLDSALLQSTSGGAFKQQKQQAKSLLDRYGTEIGAAGERAKAAREKFGQATAGYQWARSVGGSLGGDNRGNALQTPGTMTPEDPNIGRARRNGYVPPGQPNPNDWARYRGG